jgi:uncharacterized alkaline shock family protein YloU
VSEPEPVRLHVGETLVARVAAHRALRIPGVVALGPDPTRSLLGFASAALRHGGPPVSGVSATVDGGSADVTVNIVTRLGYNCRDLAVAVQEQVAAEVSAYTGLDVVVRVTVADVLLD